MIETQEKEIAGLLIVAGDNWEMLDINPSKRPTSPFPLREYVFEFLVVDDVGFARPIMVSRQSEFVILPYVNRVTRNVNFVIEENLVPVETDTLISSES